MPSQLVKTIPAVVRTGPHIVVTTSLAQPTPGVRQQHVKSTTARHSDPSRIPGAIVIPNDNPESKMKARDGRRRRRPTSCVVIRERVSRDARPTKTGSSASKSKSHSKPGPTDSSAGWSTEARRADDMSSSRRSPDREPSPDGHVETRVRFAPSAESSVSSVGSWCVSEPAREKHLVIEAPMPPSATCNLAGLATPPLTPIIPRLATPDLPPLATDVEFCACCGDDESKINEIWYMAGRAKMDSQLEAAMAHINGMNRGAQRRLEY